jgi:iron(III) transport system substrate-binding protein
MGLDYMRELAKQEPIINRDERLQVEWVAKAKYPIGMALKKEIITEFQRAGATILESTGAEGAGMSSGSDNIGLINKAAHPNAAKLYLNWFLSKEGQTVASTSTGNLSTRMDVPFSHVDPVLIPEPDKQYFFSDQEEFLLKAEPERKMAKEIFGHLVK